MKKLADHTASKAKRPLTLQELTLYQRTRLATGTPAGLRDAALAGVAFFCIRRSAEVLALELRDAVDADGYLQLRIRRQKKDPLG